MRILIVKPKHIGDSLLLTPVLAGIKAAYRDAEVWIVLRRGCEGILAGCPHVDRIITVAGVSAKERTFRDLLVELRERLHLMQQRFDYVIELGDGHRARLIAWLCRSKVKYSVNPATPLNQFWARRFTGISKLQWDACHRVEKDYLTVNEILPLPAEIPAMVFKQEAAIDWLPTAKWKTLAVMHVACRQKPKLWTLEGWVETGKYLLSRVDGIVISCGPDFSEINLSRQIQQHLGPNVLLTEGKTGWAELAGLLYRAKLLVTVDTAAMHLAAACGCRIVALFGPSIEGHWRPWRAEAELVFPRGSNVPGTTTTNFHPGKSA